MLPISFEFRVRPTIGVSDSRKSSSLFLTRRKRILALIGCLPGLN